MRRPLPRTRTIVITIVVIVIIIKSNHPKHIRLDPPLQTLSLAVLVLDPRRPALDPRHAFFRLEPQFLVQLGHGLLFHGSSSSSRRQRRLSTAAAAAVLAQCWCQGLQFSFVLGNEDLHRVGREGPVRIRGTRDAGLGVDNAGERSGG